RPRLGEPQRAVSVDRPLGVLRRAVVPLDAIAERGERADLIVGDARVARRGQRLMVGAAALARADRNALVADSPLENRARGCLDDKVIRVDGAGDHRLAEPEAGVDHRLATAPG